MSLLFYENRNKMKWTFIKQNLLKAGLIFLFSPFVSTAQKDVAYQVNSWSMLFWNVKIGESTKLFGDFQMRRNKFFKFKQQNLVRIGVKKKVTKSTVIALGYAFVETFPYGEQPLLHTSDEERVFQDLITSQHWKSSEFSHRFRLEERWLDTYRTTNKMILKDINFNLRFRYKLSFSPPIIILKNESKIKLNLAEEIFLNAPDSSNLTFGQNWTSFSLMYELPSGISLGTGMLQQYLEKGNNTQIEINSTFLVFMKISFEKLRTHTK